MKTSQFYRAALMGSLLLSGSIMALGLNTSPNVGIAAGDGGCVLPPTLNGIAICSKPAALEMDAALQAALCKALGSTDSHSLLPNDLASLPEVLDLSNQGIKGLDGLEYADHVKCINLAHNQINDILPLLGMDNLEAVSVAYNELDFQKSQGTLAVAQALKSALVFIDEGIDTQNVKPQAAFKIQNTGTMDVLTITTRAGTGYSLKGEVSKGKWETLSPLIKGTGGDVVQTSKHCLAYRLETLSSKYLLQKDPSENPRYLAYLKYMQYEPSATSWNVVSDLYHVTGNNYEGLWASDARAWYHARGEYIDELLSDYNSEAPTQSNAKDAFRMRAAVRAETRLLMGNQVIAKSMLPARNDTYGDFEKYTKNKLIINAIDKAIAAADAPTLSKDQKQTAKDLKQALNDFKDDKAQLDSFMTDKALKVNELQKLLGLEDPTNLEICKEIISTSQKPNLSYDKINDGADAVVEFIRTWSGGWVISPETKYVPLPAVKVENN